MAIYAAKQIDRMSIEGKMIRIMIMGWLRKNILVPALFLICTASLLIVVNKFTGVTFPNWIGKASIIISVVTGLFINKHFINKNRDRS